MIFIFSQALQALHSFQLEVKHISKRFGKIRVFEDINFKHRQASLGIAGPNGSGKSTLLQCLASLERPTSGKITWQIDGNSVNKNELKKRLGFAAPYINLYNEFTCRENLDFLLKLRGCKNRPARIKKALSLTGIDELSQQPFEQISTGQQQRLRISAALIHNPDVLFLDEPGSNLDEHGRQLITNIVNDFKEAQKPVFIASNNPDELAYCDRIFSVEEEAFV